MGAGGGGFIIFIAGVVLVDRVCGGDMMMWVGEGGCVGG